MKGVQDTEADWFRTTLYSIGDGVVATDAAGLILHMNPTAESLCGWTEREAQGKPIGDVLRFVSEATGRAVQSPVAEVIARGSVVGLANHTLLVARDGTQRPIADSAAPIREADGSTAGIVLVIRDQTEERQAEQALKDSEERFRLLFERMSEGVAVHDVIYDPEGRPTDYVVVDANPAFERNTGLSRSTIVGRRASEAYGTGDPPFLDVYARVANSGITESFEVFFPPLNRHFRISVYSPKTGSFATVFEDLTERIQAEEAVQAAADRYRSLFENMMEGCAYCQMIFEDDLPTDFVYLDVNQAFTDLTGLSGVVGRRVTEVIPGIRKTNPELFEAYGRVAR